MAKLTEKYYDEILSCSAAILNQVLGYMSALQTENLAVDEVVVSLDPPSSLSRILADIKGQLQAVGYELHPGGGVHNDDVVGDLYDQYLDSFYSSSGLESFVELLRNGHAVWSMDPGRSIESLEQLSTVVRTRIEEANNFGELEWDSPSTPRSANVEALYRELKDEHSKWVSEVLVPAHEQIGYAIVVAKHRQMAGQAHALISEARLTINRLVELAKPGDPPAKDQDYSEFVVNQVVMDVVESCEKLLRSYKSFASANTDLTNQSLDRAAQRYVNEQGNFIRLRNDGIFDTDAIFQADVELELGVDAFQISRQMNHWFQMAGGAIEAAVQQTLVKLDIELPFNRDSFFGTGISGMQAAAEEFHIPNEGLAGVSQDLVEDLETMGLVHRNSRGILKRSFLESGSLAPLAQSERDKIRLNRLGFRVPVKLCVSVRSFHEAIYAAKRIPQILTGDELHLDPNTAFTNRSKRVNTDNLGGLNLNQTKGPAI